MADYDNRNSGILSKNDRREKDTHPEYRGSINVDGKDYWLSAWVKERKDGSGKFFSLSVQPKEAQAAVSNGGGKPASYANRDMPDDSDIPF